MKKHFSYKELSYFQIDKAFLSSQKVADMVSFPVSYAMRSASRKRLRRLSQS